MKDLTLLTQIILNNIDSLIEEKNFKIGSFEKRIGVTSGYISRIRNGKYGFTLDLLYKIANVLNVSIDYLSTDFSTTSSDEKELIDFFESIYQNTCSGNLIWTGRTVEQIMNANTNDYECFADLLEGPIWSEIALPENSPYYSEMYPPEVIKDITSKKYTSTFSRVLSKYLGPGKRIDNILYTSTNIYDGFYHTSISKDDDTTELYLYSLEYSDESNMCKLSDVIEAYITIDKHKQNPKSHFVCSSVEWSGNISCKMKQLYKLAKTETSTNQLDTTVKSIIHSYNKQTK